MENLEDIRQILDLVREHDLSEFELERDGLKIRVRKDARGQMVVQAPTAAPVVPLTAGPAAAPAPAAATLPADDSVDLAVVTSPIVGTFYRAPEPGAAPFVEVGGRVHKGEVLCIIEAMKLMNEIECEYEGEIAKIYVENGQAVQYGERLFAINVG